MCPVLIVILNTPLLFFLTNVLVLISSVLALAKLPFWITLDLTLLCIFFVKTLPANFKKIPDKKEGIFLLQNLFLKILVLVTLNNFILIFLNLIKLLNIPIRLANILLSFCGEYILINSNSTDLLNNLLNNFTRFSNFL